MSGRFTLRLRCKRNLNAEIEETIAEANEAGYGTEKRSRRLKEVIANTKLALDLDPDRADDPE